MSTGKQIDFSHWPKGDAPASEGRAVPYLDIAGEDEPIDFLLSLATNTDFWHVRTCTLYKAQRKPERVRRAWPLLLRC